MPRSGRLRNYIKEIAESPRFEKLSFVPPFLVLFVEITLLHHALTIHVIYVIQLTLILLVLSIIEIFFVSQEIHEHYMQNIFERKLTIRLDDFIIERQKMTKNVKMLVEEFTEIYPHYRSYRNKIYHIACQILETHEEEMQEKAFSEKLQKFIRRRKKVHVDGIVDEFLKKYPVYRNYRAEIYEKACQIKGEIQEKK